MKKKERKKVKKRKKEKKGRRKGREMKTGQKKKREEYVGLVMNKLRDFFKDKNSTLIYPNLFRLLW